METIAFKKQTPKACVWVNGEIAYVGPWAMAKTIEKEKLRNGSRVEVHKARHYYGVDYCRKCKAGIIDPYLFVYEKNDYWKCEDCGHINFIKQ